MKKIAIALAGIAALSGSPMTFADSVGAAELANTQALIKELQADKRPSRWTRWRSPRSSSRSSCRSTTSTRPSERSS